jgi:hypothetical protein
VTSAASIPAMSAPETPVDSPLTLEHVMASPLYRRLMTPELAVGDDAFDFELPRLDVPGATIRLADFRGERPVALVFGSYT